MSKKKEKHVLPEGWKRVKLADISLRVHYGYTASSVQEDTGTKFLRITDIQGGKVDWQQVPFCKIHSSNIEKFLLKEGNIVFARTGATVGKSFLIPPNVPKSVFASYLIRIELSPLINSAYVYYFFQTADYWRQVGIKAVGIGQPNVNATSLSNIDFPLCSLEEQIRIVSKLEELLSGLEKSKEQLMQVLEQAKRYKQSILKNAYSGHMTRDWRLDSDARIDTLNSTNPDKLTQLPKEWKYVPLGKMVELKSQKINSSEKPNIKFLGLDSIAPNELHPMTIYNFSDYKSSANYFSKNQVLYGRMRPYLNKVWKADFEGACSGEFLVLQCKPELLPDYLKYKLHSIDFVSFASKRVMGDRPRVSYESISDYLLPLCSIEEQAEVTKRIDDSFSVIDKVIHWINESLIQIDKFKYSVLNRAFEGKLKVVEENFVNEPVTRLLEKIQDEKNLIQSQEKRKKIPKAIIMSEKVKRILEILKESSAPVTSKELWQLSDKKNDIDTFYAELKELIESGEIEEMPRVGKESFLKLSKQS